MPIKAFLGLTYSDPIREQWIFSETNITGKQTFVVTTVCIGENGDKDVFQKGGHYVINFIWQLIGKVVKTLTFFGAKYLMPF